MARRSMSNALDLTPEKLAFIAKDVRDEPKPETPKPEPLIQHEEPKLSVAASGTPKDSPIVRNSIKSEVQPQQAYGGGLVQLSVRLRPDLVKSIRRVLFEAKLDGNEKLSQQDIVEEALTEWLSARQIQ